MRGLDADRHAKLLIRLAVKGSLLDTYSQHWRAAITREARAGIVVDGAKVLSIVTPDDYASESEAQFAAEKLVRRL